MRERNPRLPGGLKIDWEVGIDTWSARDMTYGYSLIMNDSFEELVDTD